MKGVYRMQPEEVSHRGCGNISLVLWGTGVMRCCIESPYKHKSSVFFFGLTGPSQAVVVFEEEVCFADSWSVRRQYGVVSAFPRRL